MRAVLILIALLAAAGSGFATTQPLHTAMEAVRSDDWDAARRAARPAGPVALAIVDWRQLRAGQGSFEEYATFLEEYSDFPGLPLLRRRGELSIPKGADADQVLAYFDDAPPQTPLGSLRLVVAYRDSGQLEAAQAEAVRAWRGMAMTPVLEKEFLTLYGVELTPHHVARTDELLWRGLLDDAARMRPRLEADQQALLTARMALRRDEPGVDHRIAAVPETLAGDPGLAWERMEWRARRGRIESVFEIMLARSESADALGRPEMWSQRRRYVVRELMQEGRYGEAYLLASQHHLEAGAGFADLEWLSGFIALRRLDNPAAALAHFRTFRTGVKSPISLGRAGYWEGRAHEAMDQKNEALAAYAFGAEFQTSFYGQLAAEKAGYPMDALFAGDEDFGPIAPDGFVTSSAYKAGVMLHGAGEEALAARFFAHMAETLTRQEIGQLARATETLDSPFIQLKIAKAAARRGLMLHRAYFPLMEIDVDNRSDVEPALALAIARRESEFFAAAISPAGARGLMQVMPATASAMATELEIGYSLPRLTADPKYNAQLGTAYLENLREIFGPATIMVAAAYNAGPGRPIGWAKQYGDPRDERIDAIDWIETIPFRETRNYVMRVLEAIGPYRARLAGTPVSMSLSAEIEAR